MPSLAAPATDLRRRLDAVSVRDAFSLGRRIDGIARIKDPAKRAAAAAQVAAAVDEARARLIARRDRVPDVTFPEDLPVSGRRDEIARAIAENQVIVLAGETGSGKTTQLPKICLEAGLGVRGMIGHTQPRRLAARTVADRIAEEVDVEVGGAIGYQVRFTDRVGPDTFVKVMTDGILLNEIQRDKMLRGYDTLILDEATSAASTSTSSSATCATCSPAGPTSS
jgi:ATP-dependent helicase HrpA